MATFENCEIFSNYYFSYVRDYKVTLSGGNKEKRFFVNLHGNIKLLGDSRNYMPPILVPSSAICIATQILVIAKLSGRKDFILRGFIGDIIRPSKELVK